MNASGKDSATARAQLLRWAGWFAAANGGIFAAVGLRYLWYYRFPADALGLIYTALAFIGQFALLAALPVFLIVVPLSLVWPRRRFVYAVAALVSGAALSLLVLDSNVFAEQRYHLTLLTAVLFENSTWIFGGAITLMAVVFEALLAGAVWRWVQAASSRSGYALAAALILSWGASQAIHIWADALGLLPVTQLTRYLPAYFPIHSRGRLAQLGWVDSATLKQREALAQVRGVAEGQLRYPLHPLKCSAANTVTPNLMFILFDGLRPDAIDPALMPNTAALRAEGLDFANHWSGGNSSRMGIFSFFYGLPSTYWEAFYSVQQPPVLMEEVRRRGYELGLFSMPGFSTPTDTDRTVFAGVPGLPGERLGVPTTVRNIQITDEWLAWLGHHDPARSFLGFVYYDPPTGDMPTDSAEALPMDDRFTANQKARDRWRQYRLANRLIDVELGRIVASLRERGLIEHTILILFSDHGNEFDDNGLGLIGHGSDFSAAQLRATLLMRWPGRAPQVFTHRTSHHDVAATLIQDVFGCTNPPADYAVGRNLFSGESWPWISAGGYTGRAIVQPDRVIVTEAGGFIELLGPDYRPLEGSKLDTRVVDSAMRDMRRFYR